MMPIKKMSGWIMRVGGVGVGVGDEISERAWVWRNAVCEERRRRISIMQARETERSSMVLATKRSTLVPILEGKE